MGAGGHVFEQEVHLINALIDMPVAAIPGLISWPGRFRKPDTSGAGCLVYALFIVILMPIAGIIMLFDKNPETKAIGLALLIIGVILWIALGLVQA